MLNTAYSDVVATANDIYYHSISQLATVYGANSVAMAKKELSEAKASTQKTQTTK